MTVRHEDEQIIHTKMNAIAVSSGCAPGGIKWHLCTKVLDTALTDADTSQDLDLATADDGSSFPAKCVLLGGFAYPLTAIAGTGIATCTVAIGDAGNPDELLEETDLVAAAALDWIDDPGAAVSTSGQQYEASYSPIAQYVSTGGNVAAVTGTVRHYIAYRKFTKPADLA